jgi:branched-chain amino acid transport system substrate-binding protein
VPTRSLSATALACASVLIAGCSASGTGNSSVTATGKTLSIYISAPAGASAAAADVFAAEQLAYQQHAGEVTAFKLRLKLLSTAQKLSDNGRTAIEDKSAIAYVGEIVPGASADSAGITNAQDLLQVSPTDTALELTEKTPAIPNTPDRYFEALSTYGRTLARVVPSSAAEARVQVQAMKALGVKQLYVGDDGSAYGKAIASAVKQDAAPSISVSSNQSGADAVFYGANSASGAAHAFTAAAATNPNVKLFGPSALDSPTFASALGSGPQHVYISSPGFLPSGLTPAGRQFVADFKAKFGHPPATEAIFGYAAVSDLLEAIHKAGGGANDRHTVVKAFFPVNNRSSVLGTYSINAKGDISIAPFVFDRLKAGALVPSAVPQTSG